MTSSAESTPRKLKLVKVEDIGPIASKPSNPVFLTEVLAIMAAIAMILAARFLLMLSSVGGFFLAYEAIQNPDMLRIAVCIVYDIGIVAPIAGLYLYGSTKEDLSSSS